MPSTARRASTRMPTACPLHTRRRAPRSKSCVAVGPSRRSVQGAARSVALPRLCVPAHGQTPHCAVPQFGSCASSGRAWQLWAARHSQGGETGPLGGQPLPRVLEPAASKVADPTVSVNTQAPRLCRANAPVSARGIGKRRRDRPARGCTPPDGAALQSKATSSSSRTWAPSETCVGRRVYFTAFGL